MRTPTRVGNTSWTTYWFQIMFKEKPPWCVAMTWATITGLLTQIIVSSIRRYGALPNARSFHRRDGIQELKKRS